MNIVSTDTHINGYLIRTSDTTSVCERITVKTGFSGMCETIGLLDITFFQVLEHYTECVS
jgi:hypothetical protein